MKDYSKRYHKGWKPIPNTKWLVETIRDNQFVRIGEIEVSGKEVSEAMDKHLSIKGYVPYNIALKKAREKYSEANPIIITEIL